MRIRLELKIYGETLADITKELDKELKQLFKDSEYYPDNTEIEIKDAESGKPGSYVATCYVKVSS